jgi:hypothetical protein
MLSDVVGQPSGNVLLGILQGFENIDRGQGVLAAALAVNEGRTQRRRKKQPSEKPAALTLGRVCAKIANK